MEWIWERDHKAWWEEQMMEAVRAGHWLIAVCLGATSPQSSLTLCDPIDCSPPGSSVLGVLQARILAWVAMPSSRGSSRPRDVKNSFYRWEKWVPMKETKMIKVKNLRVKLQYQSFVVVFQLPRWVWLSATPWTAACQTSLSLTIYQSLPKFMFIALMMPSSRLILWHPLFLLPLIFPSIRDFSNESSVICSHPMTKILELQLQHQSFQWLSRVDFP